MKVDAAFVRCTPCSTINRLPADRLRRRPKCGKCKAFLELNKRPIAATVSSFDREVLLWPGIVLVEFWSSRCGHCIRIAPIIEALAQERAGLIKVVTVNIENESPLALRFQIRSTPIMMLYRKGVRLREIAGALPIEQLEAWIDSSVL